MSRLETAIRERPGALQTDVKRRAGIEDGQRIATLPWYLEHNGHIRRVRVGRTYQLYLADDQ